MRVAAMITGITIFDRDGTVELTIPNSLPTTAKTSRINVYRRKDRNFTFGKHYEAHFKSMRPAGKDCYDSCKIARTEDGAIVCRDENVSIGNTYVYWVRVGKSEPLGPFAVKVRDREIWWPRVEIFNRMKALAHHHPDLTEYRVFGRSALRRIISGLRVGNPKSCIALIGLVHAGESGPELMIPALERLVVEQRPLLRKTGIAILPSMNVDQRERQVDGCPWYLRKNSRGVDLNRNFRADWEIVDHMYGSATDNPDSGTYRGRKPESEPETRAVVNFIRKVRPRAAFCYHSLASICGACFLGAKAAKGDVAYVASCRLLAQAYTNGMYSLGNREIRMPFTTAPGSLPTWLYRRFAIPAFDLEHDGNEDSKPALIDRTDGKLLNLYQERHYGGIRSVLEMLAAEE